MADERRWTTVCTDERGNRLVFTNSHYWFEDETDARRMRSTLLVRECILLNLTADPAPVQLDPDHLPNIQGWFNGPRLNMPIEAAIIGGPDFEKAAAEAPEAIRG